MLINRGCGRRRWWERNGKKKKKTKKNSTKESEWASDEFLSDDVILFPFKANQVMGDILIYLLLN